jgi:hypothetical protein
MLNISSPGAMSAMHRTPRSPSCGCPGQSNTGHSSFGNEAPPSNSHATNEASASASFFAEGIRYGHPGSQGKKEGKKDFWRLADKQHNNNLRNSSIVLA